MINPMLILVGAALLLVAAVAAIAGRSRGGGETEAQAYGRAGEEFAANVIGSLLQPGERLLTNVRLTHEGQRAEIDELVISKRGVYAFEIKNYNGSIWGSADDFKWQKINTTRAGNTYFQTVKNPIKQVMRQQHILGHFLRDRGFDVWVEGYAILLRNNSPVESEYILTSARDIDRVLHCSEDKLTDKEVAKIVRILGSGREYIN